MTANEWITVAALVAGPILAVQVQRLLERLRDKKKRRLDVFKRLMATRGATISLTHVEALNMIDLEFAGKGRDDREVRRRWKEYLDNLGSLSQDPEQQKRQLERWSQRNGDLLAELLVSMGRAVGYDFDRVHIRRGIYTPLGHANFELETQLIRRGLIEVLVGRRTIPLDVRSLPTAQQAAEPQSPITPAANAGTRSDRV